LLNNAYPKTPEKTGTWVRILRLQTILINDDKDKRNETVGYSAPERFAGIMNAIINL
jgi:hypothetical protein